MPDLWDKTPDAPLQSELNPLTNPVLERNLVRWAEVYFSSPPGKREQAVNKLLEEIKREASGDRAAETQEVVCSACQSKNSAGHKFCGRCGEALNPVTSGSSESTGAAVAQPETTVQWLRDRAFRSLEVSDAPKQRGWRYLAGALAIALAGFAYLQWAPGFQARPGFQAKPALQAKIGVPRKPAPRMLAPRRRPPKVPRKPKSGIPLKPFLRVLQQPPIPKHPSRRTLLQPGQATTEGPCPQDSSPLCRDPR